MITRSELDTDLVRTSGLQPDPHFRETSTSFQYFIRQFRVFAVRSDFHHIGAVIFLQVIDKRITVL